MEIEKESLLHGGKYDYSDRFECTLRDPSDRIDIARIAETFGQRGPRWIETLLALRNRLMAPFGLKTAAESGCDRIGIFEVFAVTADEIILGQDDRHLDFRVSLFLRRIRPGEKTVTVTTVVTYRNRMGRWYFCAIRPFHRLIVPAVLKRNLRQLEQAVGAR